MADATTNRVTPPAAKPGKRPYTPAAQRGPVSVFTVMSRVKRMLDKLPDADRAGAIAWLRGQYPGA